MRISDCRTTVEADVYRTYRRILRRKGMTPFHACGLALREELDGGAVLSPNFVERFSDDTRTLVDGRVTLLPKGKEILVSTVESEAS